MSFDNGRVTSKPPTTVADIARSKYANEVAEEVNEALADFARDAVSLRQMDCGPNDVGRDLNPKKGSVVLERTSGIDGEPGQVAMA